MMKTTIKMMFAAAVVMLSACQKEDMKTPSNFPEDGVIRVTTNVENAKTRAGMTADGLTYFNIKIVNSASLTYSYYAYYEKGLSDGVWKCYEAGSGTDNPLTMLWQNSTQPVTVTALFGPANMSKTSFNSEDSYAILKDQNGDANGASLSISDYLYMEPTPINPASNLVNGKLPLTFTHLLSKVNLTVTLGTELNTAPGTGTNPITELAVNGTKASFKWNASTNSTFDLSSYDVATITPWHNGTAYTPGSGVTTNAVAKYEVILVPQTVTASGFSVSFKIEGKEYVWTSTAVVTLDRSTLYELNLTAGKDIVTLDGFTASEWTASTGGNVETE